MAATREYNDLVRQVVTEATAAFLEWLSEGWIASPGEWNVDKAQIQVNRDWYGPYWVVTFTVDGPPWWGDSITVEVEELPQQRFQTNIDPAWFARENISCRHREDGVPEGHWGVNVKPRPALSPVAAVFPSEQSADEQHGPDHAEKAVARIPFSYAGQRPRDLGWADSGHWMEEEI